MVRCALSTNKTRPHLHNLASYCTTSMAHYDAALQLLNQQRRTRSPGNTFTPSRDGMLGWLEKLGHSADVIDRLNVIHVAGTKGKGSTCAYIECLLRNHGLKTGLYTGPHLVDPEERIRLNFKPLNRTVFADYIFEVHKTLASEPKTPKYLQLLTLISFHAFLKAGVDVAIYETHHGGENDATNFIPKPAVTAITVIDWDHMDVLGPSLERIAWHKAGILKANVPAFSALQQNAAAKMLLERASEKGTVVEFIQAISQLPAAALQPKPRVQLENFSLAHAVCQRFLSLRHAGSVLSADEVTRGLKDFSWPGRFQTIVSNGITWFLDGAHNDLSLKRCAEWFAEANSSSFTILIFGHFSTHRDPVSLVHALASPLLEYGTRIQHIIFTDCPSAQDGRDDVLCSTQDRYIAAWKTLGNDAHVHQTRCIEDALDLVRHMKENEKSLSVLVTGSLSLVGKTLRHVSSDMEHIRE